MKRMKMKEREKPYSRGWEWGRGVKAQIQPQQRYINKHQSIAYALSRRTLNCATSNRNCKKQARILHGRRTLSFVSECTKLHLRS